MSRASLAIDYHFFLTGKSDILILAPVAFLTLSPLASTFVYFLKFDLSVLLFLRGQSCVHRDVTVCGHFSVLSDAFLASFFTLKRGDKSPGTPR